jgi:LacI family transcriptional regulator
MHKKVNIVTIAEKSGFSTTTVSRVLNGLGQKYRISKATSQKILSLAEELNYTPNKIAQSLRLKKSNAIGLIVPDIGNPFFANLARVITYESRKRGYSIILSDTKDDLDTEKEILNVMVDRNVDAILMAPCSNIREHIDEVINQGTGFILVDRYFSDSDIPFVTSDNYHGTYEATNFLLDNGHRNIACIQGSTHTMPNIERVQGFKDACKTSGVNNPVIVGKSFSIQNGYLETKLLLASKNNHIPTAFLCLSTMTLLGVLKALKEANLKVPDDVSIIAFDNQPFIDYLNPPITTIAQSIEEIGNVAINVLIDKLEDDSTDLNISLKLRPQLIHRDSVKSILPNGQNGNNGRKGQV